MEFINIPGFDQYQINENGDIYSTHVNRLLSRRCNSDGYYQQCLTDNSGRLQYILLHRLVQFCFGVLPCLTSRLEVDHIDTNKLNCNLRNLQCLSSEDHARKTQLDMGTQEPQFNKLKTCSCGRPKTKTANTCIECYTPELKIPKEITAQEIEYWVRKYSWVRAQKELGLSDNGLRKRYRKLTGLDPKNIKVL